jgi:hypothetical protein
MRAAANHITTDVTQPSVIEFSFEVVTFVQLLLI